MRTTPTKAARPAVNPEIKALMDQRRERERRSPNYRDLYDDYRRRLIDGELYQDLYDEVFVAYCDGRILYGDRIALQDSLKHISVLLDAKNRVQSSRSEIIYKLLGYRENLALEPYLAIGIAPQYGSGLELGRVQFADRSAMVARVPLATGKRVFERLLPIILDKLTLTAVKTPIGPAAEVAG